MKVYIVTSGEYSDYGIDRVFLDKEKAERYVELSQNGWSSTRLEEYETDDDKQIEEITYVRAVYSKDSKYKSDNELTVDIRKANNLDSEEKNFNYNRFWLYSHSGEKNLTIERVLKGEYNEEALKAKYTKVCYDLMSKIDSLLQLEAWDEKMIQEWLDQNTDEYLNEN